MPGFCRACHSYFHDASPIKYWSGVAPLSAFVQQLNSKCKSNARLGNVFRCLVAGLELTLQLRKGAVDADADLNAAISRNK